MGLTNRLFLAQRSQKMCFGQYDNDTDPLSLYLFWGVQEWLLVNLLEVPEEHMRMKLVLALVLKIFTLDLDFLGEEGFS